MTKLKKLSIHVHFKLSSRIHFMNLLSFLGNVVYVSLLLHEFLNKYPELSKKTKSLFRNFGLSRKRVV
jgi:hypothetical protein